MALPTEVLDLNQFGLSSGDGRTLRLLVPIQELGLGGQHYHPEQPLTEVSLSISRMAGGGYAFHLTFQAQLGGPCVRCLQPALHSLEVDAYEINQPGSDDEELTSPYVLEDQLELSDWVRDATVLALPSQILCKRECKGLCPRCGVDLNQAGEEHQHEPEIDPRWSKLNDLFKQ